MVHSIFVVVFVAPYWLPTATSPKPSPFTNVDGKKETIEVTGKIPLTTQVQYTHTKSIS